METENIGGLGVEHYDKQSKRLDVLRRDATPTITGCVTKITRLKVRGKTSKGNAAQIVDIRTS